MASVPIAVEAKFEKACAILDRYEYRVEALVPILQAVQRDYQYLPEEILAYIAGSLDVPTAQVFSAAAFYSAFAMQPRGKHVIRLCDGTACHVKRSFPILNAINRKLGTNDKNRTSADMMFTVETVACIGTCEAAPVAVIDHQVYEHMTPERAIEIIEAIRKEEIAALESA